VSGGSGSEILITLLILSITQRGSLNNAHDLVGRFDDRINRARRTITRASRHTGDDVHVKRSCADG
jgi:hypothetical protein